MTDRYNTLTVLLEKDIRDDDAEPLISAIRMMRGVMSVKGNVADIEQLIADERARRELSDRLWGVLYPKS